MTSGYDPVLYGLSAEPRTARPGETVRIAFRTRNLGSVPTPAGLVRFLLPAGLQALDDRGEGAGGTSAVAAAAPGDAVEASIVVRVCGPADDGARLDVQAVLETGETSLATNVCTVVVRSRPVLDGAQSGTFVEALDAETVRVHAIVTNEGDGPARDVRIEVPAPIGTEAIASPEAGTLALARLDAGEQAVVAFEARIVAPVCVVRADDARVAFAGGTHRAVPVRSEHLVTARVAPPVVAATAGRRRIDLAVDVRNDGWADARDVRVRIALPETLRLRDGSVTVDGAPVPLRNARRKTATCFARVEKAGGAAIVVLDRVAARSETRIALTAGVAAGCAAALGGEVCVAIGEREPIVAPFAVEGVRDVRVRVVSAPRFVAAGDIAAFVVEVLNLGDAPEALTVSARAAADAIALPDVEPGVVALATLVVNVPAVLDGATALNLTVLVSDADGVRARAERTVAVRNPPCAAAAPPPADAEPAVPVPIHGALVAPESVLAGAAFGVVATVDVAEAIEALAVRVPDVPGAAYVPGSTRLDGYGVLDRGAASPLAGDGIALCRVPARTRITLRWTMLADGANAGVPIRIAAFVTAAGASVELVPAGVTVRPGPAFPMRPTALPYHVDARTVVPVDDLERVAVNSPAAVPERCFTAAEQEVIEQRVAEPPAVPHRPAESASGPDWTLRLDVDRADAIARAMRGGGGNALVSHLVALRALLPDAGDDLAVSRALENVRGAARDVFDHLYVKLRIPGFDIAAADLEDTALRRASSALCRQLGRPLGGNDDGAFDAPLGSPDALRAIVALVPVRCDDDPNLAAALRSYRCALDEALARFSGMPLPSFEASLACDAGFVLADARAAVLAACRPHAMLAGAA